MEAIHFSQEDPVFAPVPAGEAGAAGSVLGFQGLGLTVLCKESGQMLPRISGQAPHIGKQNPPLPLGQLEVAIPLDDGGHKGVKPRCISRDREIDIGRTFQKLPDVLDRVEP